MSFRGFLTKILWFILIVGCFSCGQDSDDKRTYVDFTVNPNEADIQFFWKKNDGEIFKSIQNLKNDVEKSGRRLRFAMNGGMYMENREPLGLFIQNGEQITGLNTKNAEGNFYLKPNGVFYITDENKAFVVRTENFHDDGQIKFATQSGPLLIAEGQINAAFNQDSESLYIRNGVCVLDDGKIVFSISRQKVNFYDFAAHFKNLGCQNALYLDGYVSRMYLPEENIEDLDGEFGVIIAVIE